VTDINQQDSAGRIAIIGMAGRFPGARDVREFWENLKASRESITRFTAGELEVRDRERLAALDNDVAARAIAGDVDKFDAAFFNIMPREAELIDPQHRLFLECCWHAFDDAGYDPLACIWPVGVYAGASYNSYFLEHVGSGQAFFDDYAAGFQVSNFNTTLAAHAEFLATRVAYKLNLRGPAFSLGAGCATSLVAVSQACLALQNYQCDMALAGAVSITFPQRRGYLYEPGGMVSADGHCRTFDAGADGTVFGDGAGVVLLKRLEDAVADGDNIYAVILGCGINNDGSTKVGFTAPSVEGQALAIEIAHASAGVDAATITYVEAHGTGTPLGDPVEVAALTRAFRASTGKKNFCALGTAKTNVGHLDVAAGVTGLIKAALSIHHRTLVPVLHFKRANPRLDLENSPFYIQNELQEWNRGATPLRAGVSAFGMGGTNTHLVLEQAPDRDALHSRSQWTSHLLILSAKTEPALQRSVANLADYLADHPELEASDVAFTLMNGRHPFDARRIAVCTDLRAASTELARPTHNKSANRVAQGQSPPVAFMFPGQGAQHVNMGRRLRELNPAFREHFDRCAEIVSEHGGPDLRALVYPAADSTASIAIDDTACAQPAIFAVEYALAQMWDSLGIVPAMMIGHSVGEFVAACLGGVMSLDDSLALIVTRGRLMGSLPRGAMLSVRLAESRVRELLDPSLSIAAVNSPTLTVVAGPFDVIERFEQVLAVESVVCRRLATSHAFHSQMMEPIVPEFRAACAKVKFSAPLIPFISSVTGDWISAHDVVSPDYWARHLREPVRFSDGVARLRAESCSLLEVGPGATLTTLARQHPASKPGPESDQLIINSMPPASELSNEEDCMLNAVGRLWLHGANPRWTHLYPDERRRRVSLPGYPFEQQRHWISRRADAGNEAPPVQLKLQVDAGAGQSPLAALPMLSDSLAQIRGKLASIFEDLSGLDIAAMDPATSFLELGFDSLFLTQVAQQLFSTFALKITFRQLLEQQSSLDALAAYVAERVPAMVSTATVPTATVPVATMPTPSASVPILVPVATPSADASDLERVINIQLAAMADLFSRQLEVFKGAAPAAVPIVVVAPESIAAADAPTRFRPISAGATSATTPRQLNALRDLIARYTMRSARSRAYTEEHRDVLADPRAAAGFRLQWKDLVYPIVTTRSLGARLWDLDGNEYIDVVNGYGPIMLGHSPSFVVDAVAAQLRIGFETGPQTALAGEVATLIAGLTGMDRVTFCNTGSEAVVAAFRLARTVTGRDKIVIFTGDYHGMFDEVLVRGVGPLSARRSLPIAPGIPRAAADNIIVLDYGTDESLNFIRAHTAELAAVCVEPVQSRHPALVPVEFLRALRAITAASSTALIFDEVVTGFRVHPGGCQALFGIRADLATYGKVIGGGLPIGVLAGSRTYMDALDGGVWSYDDDSYPTVGVTFFAGTFVRHPLVMVAARAVLLHLKEAGPALQDNLTAKTAGIVAELNAFLETTGLHTRIETFASFAYFAWPPEYNFASLFYYWMRAKGIYIQESFPLFLTTAHSDADVAQIVRAFKESVLEMQAAGLLPSPAVLSIAPAALLLNGAAHLGSHALTSPLTEAQREIWLSASLSEAADNAYNESFTLKMYGPLDAVALCNSLNQVVARHDALRAVFSVDGESQEFAPRLQIEIPLVDLRALSSAARDTRIAAIVAEEASTPLSLTRGPLIRAQLLKLGDEEHQLVVTTHHIVCDGWSANVMLGELSTLYAAALNGAPPGLAPAMQYRDYLAGESIAQCRVAHSATENYWLAQFSTGVEPLNLPSDRSRPAVKSFRGATCRRVLGADAYQRIKHAGAKNKCTLFATLLASFQVLLARLSGQDDIVVGIPSAGQSSVAGGESLVGHCVNFLPLRSRVDRDLTFAEFLGHTRRAVLDAYEHQDYTYGTLVRKLNLPRDPSHLPLCDVQFNLERLGANLALPNLRVEVAANPKAFVNFDLFMNVVESPDGLLIDCDYNTDLFDEATVLRWLGHFETLLESFASGATLRVSQMPLMNEAERHQMLVEWNDTAADYPTNALVHQLFEEQATRQPAAIAAIFGDSRITYAQLDVRANQLANHLRSSGARDGDRVGIYLERSLDLIVAMLGILKAGCVYVPLDPIYPDDRVQFILDEAEVRLLITDGNLAAAMPSYSGVRVFLDSGMSNLSAIAPQITRDSANLAYIIYTSGSTGRPKGVEVSHRAYVNLLLAMAREPGLTSAGVMLAITTVAFDIAGLELMLPLAVGACVAIASREMTLDADLLMAEIERVDATVMQATPTTSRMLADSGVAASTPLNMLCGGESLPPDLAARLLERPGELWNMYGPTETTIWSAISRVEGGTAVNIGRPIANTQFYVLDECGQPVPIGVPGELHIGGDGVARGYFKRPDLTEAKFVRDPFSSVHSARMYRTGDLVRYRVSGQLEILGRLDRQVKLRGYRIELPEIEARLLALASIDDASVVLAADPSGEPWLVAYIVNSCVARPLDSAALRTALRTSLPDYMIPSMFVTLDALPRTLNGKVDLRALPPVGAGAPKKVRDDAAPLDAILSAGELAMRSIWQDVLGIDGLGVTDDIFALGGDSIRILQIVARARKAGFTLNAMQIFEHRTIAAVARSMSGNGQPHEPSIEMTT
jgi:amino acid adenylation domain-containing protein